MTVNTYSLRHILGWLILGTKGGVTRAQIIKTIEKNPKNANQLAILLGKDYKTIKHHLKTLQESKIIVPEIHDNSTAYALSKTMEDNYEMFEEIETRITRITQKEKFQIHNWKLIS